MYNTISYAYCNYSNYFHRRWSSGICYISRLWLKLNWSLRRIKALSENRPSTQIFAEASFFNEFMSSVIELEHQIVVILWPTSAEKLIDVTVALRIFVILLVHWFVINFIRKNKDICRICWRLKTFKYYQVL